jgi:hypothetical protein
MDVYVCEIDDGVMVNVGEAYAWHGLCGLPHGR